MTLSFSFLAQFTYFWNDRFKVQTGNFLLFYFFKSIWCIFEYIYKQCWISQRQHYIQ